MWMMTWQALSGRPYPRGARGALDTRRAAAGILRARRLRRIQVSLAVAAQVEIESKF